MEEDTINLTKPKLAQHLFLSLLFIITFSTSVYGEDLHALMLYNHALDLYSKNESTAALKVLDESIREDPNYVDAYYNKGTILYQEKNYSQAIQSFKKVVELHPEDSQSFYNLGLCYEKNGQASKAIGAYREVRKDNGKYTDAQEKIATLKTTLQDTIQPRYKPVDVQHAKVFVETVAKNFEGPTGMALGPDGILYVADYTKNVIYKVQSSGKKTVFAKGAPLKGPIGLVYDPKSMNLYVANYLSNTIVRISPKGELSILASGVHKPYYLLLNVDRNTLYVSEQETNSVSQIQLTLKN